MSGTCADTADPFAPREPGFLGALAHLLASWRFPVMALSLLLFASVLMGAVLLVPAGDGPLARFANDFKVWCFGYDPATGRLQMVYVVMLLADPLLLAGVILAVWARPLRALRGARRRDVVRNAGPVIAGSLGAVLAGLWGMGALAGTPIDGNTPLPFPAEALRTAQTPPDLHLTDHTGATVDLQALRGRVVVLTGVYASCGLTCPMIMGQAKRALATLTEAERREVTVLGVTLDPTRDDVERLAQMARGQDVQAPQFRLLTGAPPTVERVLDGLDIVRRRDPATGVIDHTNLFVVVDRAGRVAYRFTLGVQQEAWLGAALRVLLSEPGDT